MGTVLLSQVRHGDGSLVSTDKRLDMGTVLLSQQTK